MNCFLAVCLYLHWFLAYLPSGIDASENVITDDDASNLGKSQAALYHQINGTNPKYACTATIISESYLLTTSRCTNSKRKSLQANEILVRARISNKSSVQETAVKLILHHEGYDRMTLENDIALLQVVIPFTITDQVRPIELWSDSGRSHELEEGQKGYVVGLGETTIMSVERKETCSSSDPDYYAKYLHEGKTFCAKVENGTIAGSKAVGGGFYIEMDGRWSLRGIVSNGKVNTSKVDYVVLTDLAYYRTWIRNTWIAKHTNPQSGNLLSLKNCSKSSNLDWVVNIDRYGHDIYCYGSLIAPSFVLVTATCVNGLPASSIFVYNQTVVDYYEDPKLNVLSAIKSIHVHPSYDEEHHSDNLAIIELEQSLSITPVCLPKRITPAADLNLQSILLTYWPSKFEKLSFEMSDVEDCVEKWRQQGQEGVSSEGKHICGNLKITDKNRYLCQVDFPAIPLFYNAEDSSTFLRGVLDIPKADHCKTDTAPEVYLDVMQSADWIDEVVSQAE